MSKTINKNPCIICVAITGSVPTKKNNPNIPISVNEQIESTQQAFEAGASIVHCHVRNDDGSVSSDPIKFKKVNKLITSGIYRYSRNPMYLGLLILVTSTSIFYLNIFSITTPVFFYCWINRFQIKREEIFLTKKFGKEYLLYKTKTRRWI